MKGEIKLLHSRVDYVFVRFEFANKAAIMRVAWFARTLQDDRPIDFFVKNQNCPLLTSLHILLLIKINSSVKHTLENPHPWMN